ncbi:TonB-dependent receptor [Kinneretia aquatilis]|uniref:TonB-dependent receptor n=1 Tax=Kinneretia aquatilis TaxID=2070761 RepID=UPI001056F4E2|nr:TonB-dependent receptor [Paucibacter aquatile]
MQPRFRSFDLRPLALSAALALQLPAQAQAQPAAGADAAAAKPQAIEIPAQPAAQALQAFVKQLNFQLLYAPELLRGLNSKAVSGVMSPREALARLLEGSGLQIIDTGPNAATLRAAGGPAPGPRASAASAAAELGRGGDSAETPEPRRPAPVLAEAATRVHSFDLAAGDALETVQQAARLAGVSVSFKENELSGVRTNRISGEFTTLQAFQRLLADTRLAVGVQVATGEYVVRRLETIGRVEVTGSHLRSILGEQGVNPVTVLTRQEIERSGVTTLAELRNLIPQLSVGASASFDGNSSRGAPDGRLLFDLRGLGAGNTLILVDGMRLPKTGSRTVAEAYEATGIPMSAIERVEVLLGGGSAIYGADAVGGVVNIITRKRYSGTELEYARDNTVDRDAANDRLALSHAFRKGSFSARGMLSVEQQNALALRDREWLASDDRRPWGGADNTRNNAPIGGMVSAVSGQLPGIGASTAFIPAGANGSTATVKDFAGAAATERYDAAKYLNAINPYTRKVANLYADYQFAPWATLYASYNWSRNESEAPGDPVRLNTRIPAGYPGNPFGVPIMVDKYLWEQGTPARHYRYSQQSTTLGVRGDLPGDWRYHFSLADARSNPELPEGVYQFDGGKLTAAINSASKPVLLHDSLALQGTGKGPNAAGVLEALYFQDARQDQPRTRSTALALDGPIWQLPAGPVNLALGAEQRVESVKFFNSSTLSSGSEAAEPKQDRKVDAQYLEVAIPLLSTKSDLRLPFAHTLTVTGAVRRDHYNDFGAATKPQYGLLFKPTAWLALRASHNEAFRVPYLIDITRPRFVSNQSVPATGSSALIDTYRKNEAFVGVLPTTVGGNPNLKPETSTHRNIGLVFEAPWEAAKGFSLSVDRWQSEILDRVGSLTRQERLLYFPETYTRAPLSAADAAAGYTVGRINGVDNSSMNIAKFRSSGYDYALRFQRNTSWGEFILSSKITKTDRLESMATPAATPSPYVSARLRPTRSVSSLSWSYRGLGASVTMIRQAGFPVSLFPPVVDYPKTQQFNTNVWYDFGTGGLHDREGWLGHWLHNTRLSFGLINALDTAPPLSPTGNVNGSVDPRMLRYTFTLRKRF